MSFANGKAYTLTLNITAHFYGATQHLSCVVNKIMNNGFMYSKAPSVCSEQLWITAQLLKNMQCLHIYVNLSSDENLIVIQSDTL